MHVKIKSYSPNLTYMIHRLYSKLYTSFPNLTPVINCLQPNYLMHKLIFFENFFCKNIKKRKIFLKKFFWSN